MQITMADFEAALAEVKPAFGAVTDTLETYRPGGMINCGAHMQDVLSVCKKLVSKVSPSLTFLFWNVEK